jgi:histone deacetylase 1/2
LFINKALGERNAVVLWVDDFLYVCESEKAKNEFIKQIRLKFTVNIFAETRSFLGIEVNRDIDKRQLQLNQRNTTRVLLERSNMLNCNAAKTPSPSGAIFSVADCPNDPATNKTTTEYRSLIALLNFISCWTRPDITFTVNKLCKFMSNPGESHWKLGIWLVHKIGVYYTTCQYTKGLYSELLAIHRLETALTQVDQHWLTSLHTMVQSCHGIAS